MGGALSNRFRNRLGRYYDQLYGNSSADPEQDLAAAYAEVEGWAAVRYRVPLPAGVALIEQWTLVLAEELAWSHGASGKSPDNVRDRAGEVRKQLEKLADGKIKLPPEVPEAITGGAGAASVAIDPPRFSRRNMRGW